MHVVQIKQGDLVRYVGPLDDPVEARRAASRLHIRAGQLGHTGNNKIATKVIPVREFDGGNLDLALAGFIKTEEATS